MEREDLVRMMIQEVGVDVGAKRVVWMKARPDYEPLFSILDGLRLDTDRRYLCMSGPTRFEHINVYGRYHLNLEEARQRSGLRELRQPDSPDP